MTALQRLGWVFAALATFLLPGAARAQEEMLRAVEDSYPTNMAMLTDAAEAAVNEMFLNLSLPVGSTVLLIGENDHPARWLIENLLLTRLNDDGYTAYVPGGGDAAARGDRGTARDSTATLPGDVTVNFEFRFRVAECGLTYPHSYKKSPLGSRTVERLASVSLFGTIVRYGHDDVVWVGRGDTQRLDYVPGGKLALLEGKTFPFEKPVLETRGIGNYVEPALVTGIVAGLIYLFYTNQN